MGALLFRRLALLAALLWLLALPPLPRVAPLEVEAPIKPQPHVYYFPIIGRAASPLAPVASKKGVGLTHNLCADEFGSWGYDWSANPPSCQAETVPMLWDGKYLPKKLGGTSQWLMTQNEPDRPDQSNESPEEAAILYDHIMAEYPDSLLVSPAPSHLDPAWLVRFRDAYAAAFKRPPRLDALALHCYLETARDCIALVQRYEAWAKEWNVKEVWISEFAFNTGNGKRSYDAAWTEADTFIRWMDDEPMVTRYAWFAARVFDTDLWAFPVGFNASLLDKNGKPTFWGNKYK